MENEHDITPVGPEAPEDQAHEIVETMRASGTLTPEVEAALLTVGRNHARMLDRLGLDQEWMK